MFERRGAMAKVKVVLNWWIPIVLITAALMAPAISQAGSLKIWPDQLKADVSLGSAYYQTPFNLAAENGMFRAPITLPVGARITKITYYRTGYAQTSTGFSLMRIKMGNTSDAVADIFEQFSVNGDIEAVDVPFHMDPPADRAIRAGYRYFIEVTSNGWAIFWGAKIDYLQ